MRNTCGAAALLTCGLLALSGCGSDDGGTSILVDNIVFEVDAALGTPGVDDPASWEILGRSYPIDLNAQEGVTATGQSLVGAEVKRVAVRVESNTMSAELSGIDVEVSFIGNRTSDLWDPLATIPRIGAGATGEFNGSLSVEGKSTASGEVANPDDAGRRGFSLRTISKIDLGGGAAPAGTASVRFLIELDLELE